MYKRQFNCAVSILRGVRNKPKEEVLPLPCSSGSNGYPKRHRVLQVKVPTTIEEEDERFCIHKYAGLYGGWDAALPEEEQLQSTVFCSAVAIFNQALTFHQWARETTTTTSYSANDSETTYRISLGLYHACARILLLSDGCQGNSDLTLLGLAALNNEACIYFRLGCHVEFHWIMEMVKDIATRFTGTWSYEDEQTIKEFLLNVVVSETGVPAARSA